MNRRLSLPGQAAVFVMLALLLRMALFGDPVVHSDEQFYLLVGDRLSHGVWPYIDIWDRKPVGLFLLYAAIRWLGGVGIVQYQVIASLVAAATAFVVTRLAVRGVGEGARAICAGALYLVWLMLFDGSGGQSPVFYNLPIAAAGLLTLDVLTGRRVALRGAAAMLLVGVALQIKYACVFEGILFGLALLWRRYRDGAALPALVGHGLLWAGLALLPTLAAWAVYAAHDAGWTFVHANFVSIFQRGEAETTTPAGLKLLGAAAGCAPLVWLACTSGGDRVARACLFAWAAVAVAGVAIVGSIESHYLLPVLVPLCALATPSRRVTGGAVLAIGAAGGVAAVSDHIARRGDAAQVAQAMATIRPNLHGCLFVFGSEPILYHLAGTCLPTHYPFRSHLAQRREAHAIGVDPVAEVARVLASRPGVIVVREPRANANPATLALVRHALVAHYALVGRVPIGRSFHCIYADRPRTPVLPAAACRLDQPSQST